MSSRKFLTSSRDKMQLELGTRCNLNSHYLVLFQPLSASGRSLIMLSETSRLYDRRTSYDYRVNKTTLYCCWLVDVDITFSITSVNVMCRFVALANYALKVLAVLSLGQKLQQQYIFAGAIICLCNNLFTNPFNVIWFSSLKMIQVEN